MVAAVLMSILLTLMIELPVTVLEKVVFGTGKKTNGRELPTNVTIRPLDESTKRTQPTVPAP